MSPGQLELSRKLRRYLQQNRLSDHARLPPERELADTLGVTRNRLRGVLRRMAAQGEIWRHVGKGTFIGRRPLDASPHDGAGMVLTSPREVIDARLLFEPLLARLAAFNATSADHREMQLCLEKMGGASGWPVWASWDGRLHRAIAKASGNALLLTMFDTLQMYRNRDVFRTLDRPFQGIDMASRDHAAVVKAIRERDPVRAEAAMRKHILSLRHAIFGD
ncbi:MAG TPA: FCD domain-containing protein [Burkholderiales bacterium]|nr:FCD domain-containing protein [Burkholderiales bacterium]